MWSALGVNYKGSQATWDADIAYFRSIGLNKVRVHLNSLPIPWVAPDGGNATYTFWRNCAIYFKNAGFYVTWGPSSPSGQSGTNLTLTTWNNYVTAVLAEAAYLQANGITFDVFELGNEQEVHVDGTTLTQAQFIQKMGDLATSVKAVYNLSPIGYSLYDTASTAVDQWISTGLGGLDYIGFHPYCSSASGGNAITPGGFTALAKLVNTFKGKVYVTEWGMEGNDTNLQAIKPYVKIEGMKTYMNFMKSLGISVAILYTWVGYLNQDNQFAMKYTDGSFDPMWAVMLQDGKRTNTIIT